VSYLSVHLRFGTVSIRELAAAAHARGGEGAETWLSELIWRDFYFQILWHHPRVVGGSFRPEYDRVPGTTSPGCLPPGARGAPATPSSMRRCARSTTAATCTTACG
jgi:deoxyribodipyrimidine photo-lyase